jgi:hypothetical protein
MKSKYATISTLSLLLVPVAALAQESLSSSMDVYVFPTEGQETAQQQADEASCYEWATTNSGGDPFALSQQASADQQQAQADMQAAEGAGRGAGLRGAARGAAAGAIIGEIASDDASEGAAWGAAAGAVRGRRQGHKAQAQAQQQAGAKAENTAAATAEQLEDFKKAFSVCLEAKNYMVKY